jgi:histone-lysine N-methyltransferase SETD1
VGSCYLFRLDKDAIIDATRRGGMARFINHSCVPNAYARVISTGTGSGTSSGTGNDTGTGNESVTATATDSDEDWDADKHIVIFAARDINEEEEVTYDYKFPIEDKKLKCYCGAPRCKGSMN